MAEQQLAGIKLALSHLLPGTRVTQRILDRSDFAATHEQAAHSDRQHGEILNHREATLWMELSSGDIGELSVTRQAMPFSSAERTLLQLFSSTVDSLSLYADEENQLAGLMASCYAFEHVLIAQYLRSTTQQSDEFWAPEFVISQLQELTYRRYEGTPCTSGFVMTSQPEQYLHALDQTHYTFDLFPRRITLSEHFFDRPASYRYINGRDAFYLVDPRQNIIGVLRYNRPSPFSQIDRAANEHLAPLMQVGASDVWISYIGDHDDVNIILSGHRRLQWLKSHWHFIDQMHLYQALRQQSFNEDHLPDLVALVLAVSNLRLGTLILIPDDANHQPQVIGRIDDSELGEALYNSLTSKNISVLRRNRSAVGMLTSDGLTTIAKTGEVLSCGEIIRIEGPHKRYTGGGRTQAAMAASNYGLAIMVSQDGPISFFQDEQECLRLTL